MVTVNREFYYCVVTYSVMVRTHILAQNNTVFFFSVRF